MIDDTDGPIDPYSPYSLYDVLDGSLEPGASFEYEGVHVVCQTEGYYHAQVDGHVGSVDDFHADEFDDVLELVDRLNGLVAEWWMRSEEATYHDNEEALIEWAGKYVTRDEAKASENPEKWIYVPDYSESVPDDIDR